MLHILRCKLTPLFVDSARALWASFCFTLCGTVCRSKFLTQFSGLIYETIYVTQGGSSPACAILRAQESSSDPQCTATWCHLSTVVCVYQGHVLSHCNADSDGQRRGLQHGELWHVANVHTMLPMSATCAAAYVCTTLPRSAPRCLCLHHVTAAYVCTMLPRSAPCYCCLGLHPVA